MKKTQALLKRLKVLQNSYENSKSWSASGAPKRQPKNAPSAPTLQAPKVGLSSSVKYWPAAWRDAFWTLLKQLNKDCYADGIPTGCNWYIAERSCREAFEMELRNGKEGTNSENKQVNESNAHGD